MHSLECGKRGDKWSNLYQIHRNVKEERVEIGKSVWVQWACDDAITP